MNCLEPGDLSRDPSVSSYVKDEMVEVVFAASNGELVSREGPNRYQIGDALITGSTGDRWSVSRDRFDKRYLAVEPTLAGAEGRYRNGPATVLAKQMDQVFSVARSAGGDVLTGDAGDWLLQYSPGDFGVVEKARFERVYRRVQSEK